MRAFHKLESGQVVPGQPLRWDVFDPQGSLLLRKGHLVKDADQAESLIERGMYVDSLEYQASLQGLVEPPYDPFHIIASVSANLAFVLANPARDGSLQSEIETQAERITWVAEHSPDTALASMQLAEHRNYPAPHSAYTAIMADMLAQRLGWDDDRRFSTLCAALTMNISIQGLQQKLFAQHEALSSEQKRAIEQHPLESARLLIECGVNDDEWLRAVLEHHERPDGSGYPRKVRELGEIGRLIQVCDSFTAMLSSRKYRARLTGNAATKEVFSLFSDANGNPYGLQLARTVGVFPPGTLVKLANGEVGVVLKRGQNPRTPIIATLIDSKGLHCTKPLIRDSSQEEHTIVAVIPHEKSMISVPLEILWQHQT